MDRAPQIRSPDAQVYSAFISYASSDRKRANEICNVLELKGFRCWIAPRDIRAGSAYSSEIMEGIKRSLCLILVLSEASNASKIVRLEVERAVGHGKKIFPIRIEEVLPSAELELFVSASHWVEAWSGNFREHVEKLAGDLENGPVPVSKTEVPKKNLRRPIPRWILAGAGFAAMVGAIIIGNKLSGRASTVGGPGVAFEEHLKAINVDLTKVNRANFSIEVTSTGLKVVCNDDDLARVLRNASLSYAVGDGRMEMLHPGANSLMSTMGGTIPKMQGVYDDLKLAETKKLTIRYDLDFKTTGRRDTIGPFTYDVDPRREVMGGYKQRILDQASWATWEEGTEWNPETRRMEPNGLGGWKLGVGLGPGFSSVKEIWVGEKADKLELYHAFPKPAEVLGMGGLAGSGYELEKLSRKEPIPVGGLELHVKFVFHDGSESEVRKFSHTVAAGRIGRPPSMLDPASAAIDRAAWGTPDLHRGMLSFLGLETKPVNRIFLGLSPDRLTREIDVLSAPYESKRVDPFHLLHKPYENLSGVPVPFGIREIYAQLEFKSGRRGEVRKIKIPDGPVRSIELAPLEPLDPPPPVFNFAFDPAGNGNMGFLPDAPRGTERILYALDDHPFEESTNLTHPVWQYFGSEVRQWQPAKSISVIFQLGDGGESGPFRYSLERVTPLVRLSLKPELQKQLREMVLARRVQAVFSPENPPDDATRRALARAGFGKLRQGPAVVCFPKIPCGPIWHGAKEIACGPEFDQLDFKVSPGTDVFDRMDRRGDLLSPEWFVALPPDTKQLHFQVTFFDDTKSAVVPVPIQESE